MFELDTMIQRVRHPGYREPPLPLPRMARVVLAVMFGLGLSVMYMTVTGHDHDRSKPFLHDGPAHIVGDGTLVVSGERFSPGGDVFIAVQDGWGVAPLEARWSTASERSLAANQTLDPGLNVDPGGVVRETFSGLCGQRVTVQALDIQTGNFSNALGLYLDCGA